MDQHPIEFSVGHRLAYIRTYASPRVAELLVHTGHVAHEPLRRATDTALFIYELIHHGFDSPGGQQITGRLTEMHQRWRIHNDDYLWVLGTFIIPSVRIVDEYAPKPLTADERQAVIDWYRELGTRMGVTDIPTSYIAFELWFRSYEENTLKLTAAGQKLLSATWRSALSTLPRPLRPFARQAIAVLTDEPARSALGLPTPRPTTSFAVRRTLRTYTSIGRPGTISPQFTPGGPQEAYPDGYTLDDLGPAAARSTLSSGPVTPDVP